MSLFDTDLPLVAAPMAGGTSTPDLAAAVAAAGGFAFLAAGSRTAGAVAAELGDLRQPGFAVRVNRFLADPDPLLQNDSWSTGVHSQRKEQSWGSPWTVPRSPMTTTIAGPSSTC